MWVYPLISCELNEKTQSRVSGGHLAVGLFRIYQVSPTLWKYLSFTLILTLILIFNVLFSVLYSYFLYKIISELVTTENYSVTIPFGYSSLYFFP